MLLFVDDWYELGSEKISDYFLTYTFLSPVMFSTRTLAKKKN
jgi:hypothetical protein